jgi:hypothetical protein
VEVTELRPKLKSFRALRFHGENPGPADGPQRWSLSLTQTIEVGLGVSNTPSNGLRLIAHVKIDLDAKAKSETDPNATADFAAAYEAKFFYESAITEEMVAPRLAEEPYQFLLVGQVFPLAMTHFRRELQSLGMDARELPLGL